MDAKQTQQQEVNRLLGEPITLTIGGHRYKVKEPTLGVLDLMSREWLKLPDIEFKDDMSNIEALAIAKKAIAEHSHTPFEKVWNDSDRNYWMTAEEAKEYGMIDKILTRK